jgi:hypothetical protein
MSLLGNVHWKWTDSGPGPTASFYPVPPLATTAGWAIIDDDHDGSAGNEVHAILMSPVIDLTGAPANIQLEFDQYFQEYQNDSTIVGVSSDGGVTWHEMHINDGVGRDDRPNPEHITLNISEWVAADPSNVRVRFRYSSVWDYGWQVDNVAIREMPEHDLVILQGGTSHSYDGTEFAIIPPSQFPGEFQMVAELFNAGSQAMHDIIVEVELRDADDQVVADATMTLPELASWDTVLLEIMMPLSNAMEGDYTTYFTATSAEQDTDASVDNNDAYRSFRIDADWYALDGIGVHPEDESSTTSIGTNSFEDAEDQLHLMNYFPVIDNITIHGIQFRLDPTSEVGGYVYAAIHDSLSVMDDQVDAPYAETPIHDITAEDIAAGVVNLLFDQPVSLPTGAYYADLVLHSTGGTAHIRVVDDLTVPQPTLAAVIHIVNDQTYTNGNAYSIRLILDPSAVGLGEMEHADQPFLFPNPGNGLVTVIAPEWTNYSITVLDGAGAIVHTERSAGNTSMDISALSPGMYVIRVIGAEGSSTLKYVKH